MNDWDNEESIEDYDTTDMEQYAEAFTTEKENFESGRLDKEWILALTPGNLKIILFRQRYVCKVWSELNVYFY